MPVTNPATIGLDDSRRLKQVIQDLQARVKKLEANSIPFIAHQRGAIPGQMRAVQINDVGLKSSMWLNLNGNQPGLAPYQAITDASGTVRAELGSLAANGISPAQFGFRANDSTGTPIFDSLGLIAVMNRVGGVIVGGGFNTSSTTFVDITGASVTASLARQSRVLTLFHASGNLNFDTFAEVILQIDSVNQGAAMFFPSSNTNGAVTTTMWDSIVLAAGSHTWKLQAKVGNASGNWLMSACSIEVFQLGVV